MTMHRRVEVGQGDRRLAGALCMLLNFIALHRRVVRASKRHVLIIKHIWLLSSVMRAVTIRCQWDLCTQMRNISQIVLAALLHSLIVQSHRGKHIGVFDRYNDFMTVD